MSFLKRHPARRAGWTLLEMMLVVGLTGILLGFAFKLMADTNQIWTAQHKRTEGARQAWRLVADMSDELRGVLDPGKAGEGMVFQGEDGQTTLRRALGEEDLAKETETKDTPAPVALHTDVLRFPTARVSPRHGAARPGMVEYRLKRGENNTITGIEKRSAVEGQSLDDGVTTVISERTLSLNVEYLTRDGEWITAWTDGGTLPRAVRVNVGNRGPLGDRNLPTVLRYMTTVTLPTGARIPK